MQTVERTFAILRALADTGGAGISDVARATALPKSTVHRILAGLADLGIVDHSASGRYVIGAGLTSLAGSVPASLPAIRDVCRPYLMDLVAEFGEAAGLTVADGRVVLYVDQVTADDAVQTRDWTGMRLPMHTVAGGLALMATWSSERVAAYAEGGLDTDSPAAVATAEALQARLDRVRADGYAWTFGDYHEEINGVGAAIVGMSGEGVASISVYGPSFRYPGDRKPGEIGRRIAAVAATVSARLDA